MLNVCTCTSPVYACCPDVRLYIDDAVHPKIMVVAIKTPSLWRSGRDQQVHQDDGQQQQQQQGARGEEAMVGMTLHSLTSNSNASANSNADGNNDPAPRYDQRTLELSPPSYEAAAASGPRTTKGPSSVLTV